MNSLKKLFLRTSNAIQARTSKGSGLLKHVHDPRDYPWIGGGTSYIPKNHQIDHSENLRVFDQRPFNICTFAAACMAMSYQSKIPMSVRWFVLLGMRENMISGNGFSYLRAPLKLATKYGFLPLEYLPDAPGDFMNNWKEYSTWKPEYEMFFSIAEKFKITDYRKIEKDIQAFEAIDQGHCLLTASKWYQGMNYPLPPKYMLEPTGKVLGAHCYQNAGYDDKIFLSRGTFGEYWGNKGLVRDRSITEKNDFATYVMSHLPQSSHEFYITYSCDGKAVKSDRPEIYYIHQGQKFHILDQKKFEDTFAKFISVNQSALDSIPLGGDYQ